MENGFTENVRRRQWFPMWVRSSGDKNADHKKKSQALGEVISMTMPDVFWNQMVKTVKDNKKEWKIKPMSSYQEDAKNKMVV